MGRRAQAEAMETMSVRRTVEMVSVLSEGVSEELGGREERTRGGSTSARTRREGFGRRR